MTTKQFYPYNVASDAIRLEIEGKGLEVERTSDGSLKLYNVQLNDLSLEANAVILPDVLEQTLPPEEVQQRPVELHLIGNSIESRQRLTWIMDGDGMVHHRTIELDRNDWAGTLTLQALLVRTATGSGLIADFASDKGAVLAWSTPTQLLFDEPPSPPGEHIQVSWRDFESVSSLQHAQDHLFALDMNGAVPELLLNSAVSNLHRTLMNRATHGPRARVRDAVFGMILHQTWATLLGSALTTLAQQSADNHEEDSPPDLEQVPEKWKRDILIDWAPYLFPGVDADEARELLAEHSATVSGQERVLAKMANAVQTRFRTFNYFNGLVQEIL